MAARFRPFQLQTWQFPTSPTPRFIVQPQLFLFLCLFLFRLIVRTYIGFIRYCQRSKESVLLDVDPVHLLLTYHRPVSITDSVERVSELHGLMADALRTIAASLLAVGLG